MRTTVCLERRHGCSYLGAALVAATIWLSPDSAAVGAPPKFGGEKTAWHGFDRYDFLMDEADLSIKPHKAPPDEGNGVCPPSRNAFRDLPVIE